MLTSQVSKQDTLSQTRAQSLRRVWLILAMPPLLFFLVIIAASIYFGLTLGNPDAIALHVEQATPYLLLIVQTILLALFWLALRAEGLGFFDIGWQFAARQMWWREILVGAGVGFGLGVVYLTLLAPWMMRAQQIFGDSVPPGELFPALGAAALPFFIANVALAPFVEENIYRGYAMTRLAERFKTPATIIVTCAFFGLLHWAGGFWYILLTGIVAGGLLATLRVWRKNLVAPFRAHLILNLVEFVFVWFVVAR